VILNCKYGGMWSEEVVTPQNGEPKMWRCEEKTVTWRHWKEKNWRTTPWFDPVALRTVECDLQQTRVAADCFVGQSVGFLAHIDPQSSAECACGGVYTPSSAISRCKFV